MKRKTKVVAIGAIATLLLAAGTSIASAKSVLDLKKDGASSPLADGSTVAAGWYVGFGEHYYCQVVPLKEGETIKEGSMVLNVNAASKDKATGSVAAPPCYESEEEAEPGIAFPSALRRRHARTHRHIFDAAGTTVSATGGLKEQEVTTAHKGSILLSAPLVITVESAGKKCAYESKSKLKGSWPPEENPEFPNITKTADIASEIDFKLDKTLTTATDCAKSEEGYVETWLGPLGEELEAQLVS